MENKTMSLFFPTNVPFPVCICKVSSYWHSYLQLYQTHCYLHPYKTIKIYNLYVFLFFCFSKC